METLTFDQLPAEIRKLGQEISEVKQLLIEKSKPPIENHNRFLTIQEAALFLSLSVATLYTKVSRNQLPFMKRGKRLYFSESELIEYLKSGRRKPKEEIEQEVDSHLSNNKKGGAK